MKYWTTKEGVKIKLTELSDSHLDNCIKMMKRDMKNRPPYAIYNGQGEAAEDAVEQENRVNEEIFASKFYAMRALVKEQGERKSQ